MTATTAGRLALLAPALLVLAGCAGQGQVSGKVRYQGKPLPSGTITFYDRKNNTVASAIHEDGSYSVEKVVAGPVKITVMTPMAVYMAGDKPPPGPKPPTLPPKYADAAKSGLDFEVKDGPQTHDFDLQ
jgi:hypothetical protein